MKQQDNHQGHEQIAGEALRKLHQQYAAHNEGAIEHGKSLIYQADGSPEAISQFAEANATLGERDYGNFVNRLTLQEQKAEIERVSRAFNPDAAADQWVQTAVKRGLQGFSRV